MKSIFSLIVTLVLGLTLAACGTALKSIESNPVTPTEVAYAEQPSTPDKSQGLTRSDTQGAVTFEVTPDNLGNPGNELVFEISMNTHSIDLSMDLATLATLTTDSGNTVQASLWDAPLGGHHVSGKLSFPVNMDGNSLFDGATKLSLIIKDVDAPQRVFTWDLQN